MQSNLVAPRQVCQHHITTTAATKVMSQFAPRGLAMEIPRVPRNCCRMSKRDLSKLQELLCRRRRRRTAPKMQPHVRLQRKVVAMNVPCLGVDCSPNKQEVLQERALSLCSVASPCEDRCTYQIRPIVRTHAVQRKQKRPEKFNFKNVIFIMRRLHTTSPLPRK